ncbi:unnamed protein product [Caenorhabditis auriculariae]|uniref:Thioredoxin domain-containing protein n=1 Tax=Caenorhabditis auriculariae TaxID=2777116 RepID=A0A8S1GU20_9PELO|nr:unnamed protein product [Caenorhabditis auriculariae]
MRPTLFTALLSLVACSVSTNPPTSVLELNDKFLEVKNNGFWFVEFYAPWCAHCKRLHPTWDQLGHAINDKNLPIRVAKLDCTRFPAVANALSINGFPTIAFFRNGRRIAYHGAREKEALYNFALKCAAPIVESVDLKRIEKIRLDSRSDPSFVFYGNGEEDQLYKLYSSIADEFFSLTRFYSVAEKELKEENQSRGGRISVLKDNLEDFYHGDREHLEEWIKKERYPSFVAASPGNLVELGTSGKLVVLVVSSKIERFNQTNPIGQFHSMITEAIELVRKQKNIWDRYQFAWLDGPDLASTIQMSSVDEPSFFVFNYTTYEYYLSNDETSKMTSRSVATFLDELAGAIDKGTAVPYGGRAWPTRIRRMAFELYWNIAQMFATQPLLSSCLFGVPIAFLSIICYSICSADFTVDRDEFFPEDEEEEELLDEQERAESEMDDDDHEKAD